MGWLTNSHLTAKACTESSAFDDLEGLDYQMVWVEISGIVTFLGHLEIFSIRFRRGGFEPQARIA